MKLGLTENQYNRLLNLILEQAEPPASEPEAGTSSKQAGGQGYPQVGKWESGVTRGPGNQVGVTKWADVVGAKLNRGKANPLKEIQYTKRSLLRLIKEQSNSETQVNQEHIKMMVDKEQPKPPIPAIQVYEDQCKYYANGECPFEMKSRGGDVYYWYYHSEAPTNTWMYTDELHGAGYGAKPYKLGNYNNNDFVGRLSDMTYYYETELDWWLRANMNSTLAEWKRYHGRVSKSGKEVPKGFDPNKYDEYLVKQKEIQDILNSIEEKHKSHWNPFKSNFGPGGHWNQKDLNYYNSLKQQLVNLKNEYSNDDFSYGITKEELELYNTRLKEINDEFTKKINDWNSKQNPETAGVSVTMNTVSGTYNPTTKVEDPDELKQIKKEWKDQIDLLNILFGKDNWSNDVSIFGQSFDKLWDKWGTAIQVVGNIAIIALSGGIAGIATGTVGAIGFTISSGAIRAAAPYVADAVFNSLVGTYEASRGKNKEAVISFLCAMVPYISWSKNIGKVSIETCENLSKKIILTKFNSKESMEIFIQSLTPEERYVFRDVMSMPKEAIKDNFNKSIERITKIVGNEGLTIPKAGVSVWGPKLLKQFGIEGGIPLSGMIIESFFDIIKNTYGHIYTKEELILAKKELDKLKTMNNIELLIKTSKALTELQTENISKENKPNLVKILSKKLSTQFKDIPDDVVNSIPNKEKVKVNMEKIINKN